MKDVVETLRDEMDVWRERAERAEARLASITGMQRQELARDVAERQREADLSVVWNWLRDKVSSDVADEIPELPLVTEVES